MSRITILLGVAIVTLSLLAVSSSSRADPSPLKILTLCDSISQGPPAETYQAELSRLLTDNGIPNVVIPGGVGGSGVEYWATHAAAVMNQYQPDLVLLDCGTNDTWTVTNSVANFQTKYRITVEAILNWRTPNRVKLGQSYIGYGTYPATQSFIDGEPLVNLALNSQIPIYSSFTQGVANFQVIPPNNLYIKPDGIHPTVRGYKAMARIWYDAMAAGMGWPVSQEPPLCGMDGAPLQRGYARATALACPGQ